MNFFNKMRGFHRDKRGVNSKKEEGYSFIEPFSLKDKTDDVPAFITLNLDEIIENNLSKSPQDIIENIIKSIENIGNGEIKINSNIPSIEETLLYSEKNYFLLIKSSENKEETKVEIKKEEVLEILHNRF